MKSLLGLASQLRGHAPSCGALVAPLHVVVPSYKVAQQRASRVDKRAGRSALLGTARSTQLSETLLRGWCAVSTPPHRLLRGTGVHLLQVVDSASHPTLLTSRTVSKCERSWSTAEKKALAIFYLLTHRAGALHKGHSSCSEQTQQTEHL